VLLVIEPTLSGLHDAKRLKTLVDSFNIPVYAVINKFDINEKITNKVESYLFENKIPLIGRLPFNTKMVESMVHGKTIIEYLPKENISREFYSIWEKIIQN
jgi:MinD superfamily P-loop ATPase